MKYLLTILTLIMFISFSPKMSFAFNSNRAEYFEVFSLKSVRLSDTIAEQLKTVEKLKSLMDEKKYDQAILCFSKMQQQKINKLQQQPTKFNQWCLAWTLDEAKYQRYVKRIKSGYGTFVFEENEWKISEN